MFDLFSMAILFVLFVVSYFIGTSREKAHFEDIVRRERDSINLAAVTLKTAEDRPVSQTKLVMGNVVISGDYFKQVTAQLASVFGMKISVAESLIDRARREAILRMKGQAPGADIILNVRVMSMKIGDHESINGVEAMAYGTAVYYSK